MSAILHDPLELPAGLPVPVDDGAARHLVGASWPDLALLATDGSSVNLSRGRGRAIVYAYPRTGRPGHALPTGWDAIPGARGCTPQSCGFRDHFAELNGLGVAHLYGLSTQERDEQREVAQRLHLPFALLSDARLEVQRVLSLPTFGVDGMTLLKRLTMVLDDGVITKVFYPVFPPDRSGAEVVAWLRAPADPSPPERR
jgi:peroxiredoxin